MDMGILKDLREVFRGMKKEKLGKRTPKFCPICGSPRIGLSSSFNVYPRMFGLMPRKYVCETCGYTGPVAMELEEEAP
jgi:C4-type Zn-finger protein